MTSLSFYKNIPKRMGGSKCKNLISCFFIISFNFVYAYIVNCGLNR